MSLDWIQNGTRNEEIKWKKKYHSVRTVPKSKRKIVERSNINRSNTQICDLVQAHPWKVAGWNNDEMLLNYFQNMQTHTHTHR